MFMYLKQPNSKGVKIDTFCEKFVFSPFLFAYVREKQYICTRFAKYN